MIRKLSLAVAVATALSPVGALALGLGEIHPQSALNQAFKADIDLLSVSQEELQDVRVSLASREAFEKAGMERPYLLTGLKFAPMLTPAGKPVISISSSDAIREPFLNFLIEVNWPKGRLVREYTVLLDPPVTLKRAPQPVIAPTTTMTPTTQVSRSRPAMVTSSTSSEGGAREYGPVQPNDNLWNIAKGMQRSDESVEQVMMALQRHNPSAFINNNVNNLKVGKILRLPEDSGVTSISKREARDEFLAQTRAWQAGRTGDAPRPVVSEKPTETEAKEEDRLRLISAKPGEGEAAEREGMAESESEIDRLQDEIMLVRESNEGVVQENDALRSRVQELEKQIKDIQRLLTLKSDQLAEIQSAQDIAAEKMEEMEAVEAAPAEVPEPEMEPEVAEDVAATEPELEPTTVEAEEPVVPVPPGTVIEEVDIEARIDEAMQQEAPVAETTPPAVEPEPAPAPTPAPTAQPEPAKPPVAVLPPKKVSYFDGIKENSTLLGIVGGVAVLLIGLLWMIMRRRKEAEAEFAESILVSPDSGVVTAGKEDSSSLTAPTDETSFMSDFSPSDIDALQDETGEVDPLSEADVYIAYGRYQQAEELIKQAIEKNPEREELKHKLAEIYFSAKKHQDFNSLAQQLHDAGLEDKEPETWSKIAAMGKELDPSYALFAGAAGMAAGGVAAADEALDDLGLNLGSEPAAEAEEMAETPEAQDSSDLEIDSMDLSGLENLDEMDSESLEGNLSLDSEFLNKMESGESPAEEEEALDIDLSDLDMDSEQSSAAEEPQPFDLSDVEGDSEIAADLGASDVSDAIELEDSETLDNLDLESIEKELEGLSSDLDSEDSEAVDELSLLQSHSENLDLDSTDEITTKLDLARAYIDMGDIEGAKSILDEVSSEGSEAQQKEAQELLNGLGA
ncbi:MAG: FimV/HubP family polar landmark protein [Candidatus Thiodiazotropha endolucinida]